MGVDVSNGTGADYSAITIVSVTTGQPVYHWRDNKTPPFKFAEQVREVWEEWNEPLVLTEGNGVGAVVLGRLEEWCIPMWKDHNGRDWTTGKTSKARILERLREMLERGELKELEDSLVEEILHLVPNKWGGASASRGWTDDMVISFALALECREACPNLVQPELKVGLIDRWRKQVRAKRIRIAKLPFRPATIGKSSDTIRKLR
jgi:hypothetical protein